MFIASIRLITMQHSINA